MEALFAHTYLILFGKLAAGGLLALAVPPFTSMERGYYTSSAAVFLAAAYLMLAADGYLYFRAMPEGSVANPVPVAGLVAWAMFTVLFSAYYLTLFFEPQRLRAALFPFAVAAGFLALATTGLAYLPPGDKWYGAPFLVVPLLAGAALTGASVNGMLLGHWYLIDSGLEIEPLRKMLTFCRRCLKVEIAVVVLGVVAAAAWPDSPWRAAVTEMFSGGLLSWLALARVAAWALAALTLALAARALAIPHTMAATGLFYIEALAVCVGQIIAHWLLFRTGLAL